MPELSQHTRQLLIDFVKDNTGLTAEQIKKKIKAMNPGTVRGAIAECLDAGELASRGWRPMRIFPVGQGDDVRDSILTKRRSAKFKLESVAAPAPSNDVLITVPYGNGLSLTLSLAEAKQVRDVLSASLK